MAGGNWSLVLTVSTGDLITAAERNNEFLNVLANSNQDGIAGASEDLAHMQSQNNPAPGGTPSLATSGRGEIQAMRYMLAAITGNPYWYTAPGATLAAVVTLQGQMAQLPSLAKYRQPTLVWDSLTAAHLESGLDGTSGDVSVLFPDNTLRTTNNLIYTKLDTTRNAVLSGTKQSGLRTGALANNTWYAVYAVKATDSSDIILVADTTLPTQANYATLNGFYGTSGWRYCGMLRNGDQSGTATGLLKFLQVGARTYFYNVVSGLGGNAKLAGISMAHSAGASTVTWAYSAGTAGQVIPDHLAIATFQFYGQGGGNIQLLDSAQAFIYMAANVPAGSNFFGGQADFPAVNGATLIQTGPAEASISLAGFEDRLLASGSVALL